MSWLKIVRFIAVYFISVTFLASSAWLFAGESKPAGSLPSDAHDVCPIKVGETVPDVALNNVEGESLSLAKVLSKKPSVVIFYRGSWCPYCNTQLGELQTIENDLKDLGYQLIAVSPDLPANLKTSISKNKLSYEVFSDASAEVIKALGLAFKVDAGTYEKYLSYNIDLEAASGQKHHLLPVPAALIVDKNGEVKFIFHAPDYKVRIEPQVLLAAAKASL